MKAFAGVEIPESLQDAVRPDRTALVVYDMQVGILQQLPSGKAVLEKVLTVLDAARSAERARDLHAAHVAAEAALRRVSAAADDGLAAQNLARRCSPLVPAQQSRLRARA